MRRLKTRPQFQAVMAGTVVARTPHFVLHRLPLSSNDPSPQLPALLLFPTQETWVGAMLPKRWAKRSVTRHAIKRQIYSRPEWELSQMSGHAHVIRMRSSFSTKTYPSAWSDPLRLTVRKELEQLLRRFNSDPAS